MSFLYTIRHEIIEKNMQNINTIMEHGIFVLVKFKYKYINIKINMNKVVGINVLC